MAGPHRSGSIGRQPWPAYVAIDNTCGRDTNGRSDPSRPLQWVGEGSMVRHGVQGLACGDHRTGSSHPAPSAAARGHERAECRFGSLAAPSLCEPRRGDAGPSCGRARPSQAAAGGSPCLGGRRSPPVPALSGVRVRPRSALRQLYEQRAVHSRPALRRLARAPCGPPPDRRSGLLGGVPARHSTPTTDRLARCARSRCGSGDCHD